MPSFEFEAFCWWLFVLVFLKKKKKKKKKLCFSIKVLIDGSLWWFGVAAAAAVFHSLGFRLSIVGFLNAGSFESCWFHPMNFVKRSIRCRIFNKKKILKLAPKLTQKRPQFDISMKSRLGQYGTVPGGGINSVRCWFHPLSFVRRSTWFRIFQKILKLLGWKLSQVAFRNLS